MDDLQKRVDTVNEQLAKHIELIKGVAPQKKVSHRTGDIELIPLSDGTYDLTIIS